jgi:DNA (cytosine-5)-methyltransferase 1
MSLVLSLFPGIGLFDMAFEEEGFSVVRGPDLLWGGDIRSFHPPAGVFDGVIGGPPCQRFTGLGNVNRARWGDGSVMPDMIPEFARIVLEAGPTWWVMENVPAAPLPGLSGEQSIMLDNHWLGETKQGRLRRFTSNITLDIAVPALVPIEREPTVVSTGQADWKGSAKRHRASIRTMCASQGLHESALDHTPFTVTELRRAIANGVPLPMGRAIAKAVKQAMNLAESVPTP